MTELLLQLVELVRHLGLVLAVLADEIRQLVNGLTVELVEDVLGLQIILLRLSLTLILLLFEFVRVYFEDELEDHFDELGWQVHQHV